MMVLQVLNVKKLFSLQHRVKERWTHTSKTAQITV